MFSTNSVQNVDKRPEEETEQLLQGIDKEAEQHNNYKSKIEETYSERNGTFEAYESLISGPNFNSALGKAHKKNSVF